MLIPPDLYADTWVATDALGRSLPIAPRAPRKDRYVGLFYFVWHGAHGTPGPYDLSKILGQRPPPYGPVESFHWWSEPEIGYFRSDDPWVQRRNLEMLAEAGVDTLFVDVTNATTYPAELNLIFQVARWLRAHGVPAPQVAFVLNSNEVPTLKKLWNEWYKDGRNADLWFRWQGKPLILANPNPPGEPIPEEMKSFFTWRHSWFETDPKGWFGDGRDRWPWRDRTPQNYGWHDDPKVPEEVAVGVASHPTNDIGRSYKNGKGVETDAKGVSKSYLEGIQFQEQWDRALAVDPKMVFVTGWNEWVAQRFLVPPQQFPVFAGGRQKPGDTFFVDEYSPEYSRDIDPMKGGYGDNYYLQLVANIRRFKGAWPVPKASGPHKIVVKGPFSQWAKVGPEYRDPEGDTMHRDWPGWGSLYYKDDSGRNDIVAAKVARDDRTVSFYVRTAAPLTPSTDPDWMILYLDTDRNAATGWHGYEYRVAKGLLEKWNGAWVRVADVAMRVAGNELQLAVPRSSAGVNFDFKWADHCGESGEFIQGDAAPPRRFNYRYQP